MLARRIFFALKKSFKVKNNLIFQKLFVFIKINPKKLSQAKKTLEKAYVFVYNKNRNFNPYR